MSRFTTAPRHILTTPRLFSDLVIGISLRPYQLGPILALVDSVLNRRGHEFLITMPRQSGKNEAIAHLLVYLLNIFQRSGGNIVYGAIGDGLGRGLGRLEERLDNKRNIGHWTRSTKPIRRSLGKPSVVFLSSHPSALARGETAHHLLVIDELQDQDRHHLEAVFQPMRSANNASALYIGTVRTTSDALWHKKSELEPQEQSDGIRRVWIINPEQVIEDNPAYGYFLNDKLKKLGRHHPIVSSEYFNEPLD